MNAKEIREEAKRLGVDLSGCVERDEMVAKLEAAQLAEKEDPSEVVGEWTLPHMKGYLLKDAVHSKSNTKKRYFVVVGNFLMYYEKATDPVYRPKGMWCLDDCRAGMVKRVGLGERQACLLRGKRELVLTAETVDELKSWNKALQRARRYGVKQHDELETTTKGELQRLRAAHDSTLIELETTKSKLREERDQRHRAQLEAEATKEDASEVATEVAQQAEAVRALREQLEVREGEMVEEMAAEKRRAEEALAELSAERKASEFRRGSVEAASAAAVAEAVDGATQGLKVQMEELREQLHREIEARQAGCVPPYI